MQRHTLLVNVRFGARREPAVVMCTKKSSDERASPTVNAFIMSEPLVNVLFQLFRDQVDDPAPEVTADYMDASMNFEEIDYENYRLRCQLIRLADSLLITSVDKHPEEGDNSKLRAFFNKMKRLFRIEPSRTE
jgi:hypothetical protein